MTSTIDGNQVQIAETTSRKESSSPRNPKTAKTKASSTKPSQPSPNDEDGEKTRANGGEEEPPVKGLYDIFAQTRRCEERCYELGLTLRDIRKIKKKYDKNDMYHTGEITQAEFFFIINETRRPLTTGIFQYANVSMDQKFISFDEYLLCVVSFASLTPPELFQFVFDLYDADKSGSLDDKKFATMSKELQSHQFAFPKNVATAIAMIEGKDPTGKKDTRRGYLTEDGLVDLNEFLKFTHLSRSPSSPFSISRKTFDALPLERINGLAWLPANSKSRSS